MIIETSRFGPLEVDEHSADRVSRGVLDSPISRAMPWLQTAETVASTVAGRERRIWPSCLRSAPVRPDYCVPVKLDELSQIHLQTRPRPRSSSS